MRLRSSVALFAGAIVFTAAAMAQAVTDPLSDQLRAVYKTVKMGSDSTGTVVLEPGTVLVIQKPGILGVPPGSFALAQHTYAEGSLRGPNQMARRLLGKNTRYFQTGEKVYATKLAFKSERKRDEIIINIVECDSCNGADQPSAYKAEMLFEFPAGYLATVKAADVQNIISQVLSIDTAPPALVPTSEQIDKPLPPIAAPAPPPDAPAAAPATVSLGQTVEQVVAALGQPAKKADLGTKQIYYYQQFKVTFVDGKVANVE